MAEKLRRLEAEKKNLLLELDELKKQTESKAVALESEVSMLKEEVESFRTLLGLKEITSEKTEFEKVSEDPPVSKPEEATDRSRA